MIVFELFVDIELKFEKIFVKLVEISPLLAEMEAS